MKYELYYVEMQGKFYRRLMLSKIGPVSGDHWDFVGLDVFSPRRQWKQTNWENPNSPMYHCSEMLGSFDSLEQVLESKHLDSELREQIIEVLV